MNLFNRMQKIKKKKKVCEKKIFLVWICVAIFNIEKKPTINNLNNKT